MAEIPSLPPAGIEFICDAQTDGYRWHCQADGIRSRALSCRCQRAHLSKVDAFIEAWSWYGALSLAEDGAGFKEMEREAHRMMALAGAIEAVGLEPEIEELARAMIQALFFEPEGAFRSWLPIASDPPQKS